MRRIAAVIGALGLLVLAAAPAQARYTHLGATTNVALSVQWSQQLFPTGATSAIVVRDDGFADSLAAGADAGASGAPVLMNPPAAGLDPRIENELARLGATRVLLIGGTAAVSAQTESDLQADGYLVVRSAGANRIETAAHVMQDEFEDVDSVVLARAFGDGTAGFADSLGAGMLAGSMIRPLLLTETATLSTATRDVLAATPSVTRVVIAGGTAAVSDAVVAQLQGMGLTVERVAGTDRFATAVALASRSLDDDGIVALVDGVHANARASGVPASASGRGAVVLANGTALPEATRAFLDAQPEDAHELFCSPEVDHNVCLAAEAVLNG
jgi:putative cell wall-binding protein